MQLAIREMTQQATSPRFWAVLLCIVCILTVAAPFSTGERFSTVQLFIYWGGIAVSTNFCSTFILQVVLITLRKAGKSEITARVFSSLAAAFTVAMLVLFINTVILGVDEINWGALALLGISCMLIALAISTIFFIVDDTLEQVKKPEVQASESTSGEEPPESIEASEESSPFYLRLTKSLGNDVISLQAQDHYVDVRTTHGNELILIRLSDAIKELGEKNGIRVHRSWWVTHKHMVEQKKVDGKQHLVLSDGSTAPVSRTYSSEVKAALTQ